MYRVFIAEDDEGIARALENHLKNWGLDVRCVDDFRNVTGEFSAFSPHIVLLDISLPFYNGFYWCTEIRKLSNVPIVFISSASDNMNIVMAMNMGGDDFVVKPFDLNFLLAKINSLLRRTYDFQGDYIHCALKTPTLEFLGSFLATFSTLSCTSSRLCSAE